MFERGPFKDCRSCGESECLGILSVGRDTLTRRCKRCRYQEFYPLPALDKTVIYLDQLAFSELFKIRSGTRRPNAPSHAFWIRAERALARAVSLQQVVCPTSNIHSQETIVFDRSVELRTACELIGGDIDFTSVHEIEAIQFFAFADAFQASAGVPTLKFDVDDVLNDDRNSWLPDLLITTNMDLSTFADEIRLSRESGSKELQKLTERWRAEKPKFKDQLDLELKGWGTTLTKTYVEVNERRRQAMDAGDLDGAISAGMHRVNILMRQLMGKFRVDRDMVLPVDREQFVEFMQWEGLEQLPYHRISAYLFAALSRRYANGQTRSPSRGTFNDFEAIATYGPYVDAMFLDRECATLLTEEPLKSELPIKARIFSTANGDEFLQYLEDLIDNTPDEVKSLSEEIYGLTKL